MVEIPDRLACLFTAPIADEGDSYTIEVPKEELDVRAIMAGETYRVVILEGSKPTGGADQQEKPRWTRRSQRLRDHQSHEERHAR